jgi:Domain of unknown function (DUF1707)
MAHDGWVSTPSDGVPPLRIGTQEREAAYKALDAHLDAGRLDAEEYGERYAKASMARTRPELELLFVDLPLPHPSFSAAGATSTASTASTGGMAQPNFSTTAPGTPPWQGPRRAQEYARHYARMGASILAIVPFIAIALFFLTGAWIAFLLIPIVATLSGRARHHGRQSCSRR